MPRLRAFQVVAAACLLCVGCPVSEPPPPRPGRQVVSPSPSPGAAAADPTLRWAINEPTSIIPIDATTPDDLLVVDALYDSLTSWADDLSVQPSVARTWRGRRNSTVWRFLLRSTARFSDGTPVTASHFVNTWSDMARHGRAHHHLQDVVGYRDARRGKATALRGVRAVDAQTLEVRLSRPLAEFPAVVAHPALAPMPAPARTAAARDKPIGNGAFRMAEPWAHAGFVRLTRTERPQPPDAQGSTPLHEVVFQIQDAASAYIAYEQGGVDVATVPPIAVAAEEPPARPTRRFRGPGLLRGDLPSTYLLVCNLDQVPCDSIRARRGLSVAVDRRRLSAEAFYGAARPAAGVLPPGVFGSRRSRCSTCTTNPGRARQLLDRAGVERTQVWISKGGDHEPVARRIQADLSRAGVTATIKAVPFDAFLAALRSGEPGLFRFGWTLDYPTGDSALRPLFHSRGRLNYTNYRRSDVDTLLDAGAAAPTPQQRDAAYRAAEDVILGRDQAVIPVAGLRRRTVVAQRVRNLVYGPMGTADLAAVRILEPAEE